MRGARIVPRRIPPQAPRLAAKTVFRTIAACLPPDLVPICSSMCGSRLLEFAHGHYASDPHSARPGHARLPAPARSARRLAIPDCRRIEQAPARALGAAALDAIQLRELRA